MARSLGVALPAALVTTIGLIAICAWHDDSSFWYLIEVTGLPAFIVGSFVIIVWKLIEAHFSKMKQSPRGFEVIFKKSTESKGD